MHRQLFKKKGLDFFYYSLEFDISFVKSSEIRYTHLHRSSVSLEDSNFSPNSLNIDKCTSNTIDTWWAKIRNKGRRTTYLVFG